MKSSWYGLLRYFFLFSIFILLFCPSLVCAEDKPILVINTGAHVNKIVDLVYTSDGRRLISASNDKTIRIWDVEAGKTIKVLRCMADSGGQGKINALALSPDDKLVAAAGYGYVLNGKRIAPIHIYDLDSGRMVRTLDGHIGKKSDYVSKVDPTIRDLAFSADGTMLVSGSRDRTARVWDVRTGHLLRTLSVHEKDVHAVAFSPDSSRIVTGGGDQRICFWDVKSGALLKSSRRHKKAIRSLQFMPNGDLLSAGFDKVIRMWDRDGGFIQNVVRSKHKIQALSVSPDGSRMVFGTRPKIKPYVSVSFSLAKKKKLATFKYHHTAIIASAISPDGEHCATGDFNGRIFIWNINTGDLKKSLRGMGGQIWSVGFSKDGKRIAWGRSKRTLNIGAYGPLEQSFRISPSKGFSEFVLGSNSQVGKGFNRSIFSVPPWRIDAPRMPKKKFSPKLIIFKHDEVQHVIKRNNRNGKFHKSITLTPDGKAVISGSKGGRLEAFDTETGKKRYAFVGHTGDIWALAPSPDGRLLVSGAADQTVRIWEIHSGRLLATVFSTPDGEWVAWTPEGFFASSERGSEYVGWQVNRGIDKTADFFPAARLYEFYYRPDLVLAKLKGDKEADIPAAIARFNLQNTLHGGLAPEIAFLSPPPGGINKRDIKAVIRLKDQGGGVGKIVWKLNGVTIGVEENDRGITIGNVEVNKASTRTFQLAKLLTLSPGQNIIEAVAYNRQNEVASKPVTRILNLKDAVSEKPRLHILVVGIDRYRDKSLWLNFAVADARELAKQIQKQSSTIFEKIWVAEIYDAQATHQSIKRTFEKISKTAKSSDVFIFYMAGHGITLDGRYHFLPVDFRYHNEDAIRERAINQDHLQKLMGSIPAQKSLILLDTCNSGSYVQAQTVGRGIAEKTAIVKLTKATGRAIIAASSDTQVALEGYNDHGVFTYALLQGLSHADKMNGNRDGVTSTAEVASYVNQQVPEITYKKWGYEQVPQVNLLGREFPIGIARQ